ncbi:MAG: hypothetical protein KDL87_19745, partial [Verrucomicrobiae bacterium]|nr:hypothetical protein [Verrucomicrobiae bacterium]
GGLYQNDGGLPLPLTSLTWSTAIDEATGASAKGLGNVTNPFGDLIFQARFSKALTVLMSGQP